MPRGPGTLSRLVGIAMLGILVGSAGTAQAAGININAGGIRKVGDPFYLYVVEVTLDPLFEFRSFDSFTLHNVAGLHFPGSLTGAPSGDPTGPWATVFNNQPDGPIPNFSPPTIVPFADITWINAGPDVTNPGPGEKFMGEFSVLTAISLPFLPDDYSVTIDWTGKIHDPNGDPIDVSGQVTLGLIIPEPSSVALLAAGLGLPALCLVRRHRRKAS
jgi:hypothetical protein